jgi:hypothetical protein
VVVSTNKKKIKKQEKDNKKKTKGKTNAIQPEFT